MVALMDGDFSTGHLLTHGAGLALATVKDTVDPERRGRLQVKLAAFDVTLWAPCVVPSAGKGYGVAMLPKVNEVVLLAFLTPEQPVILGALWSGRQSEPDHAMPTADRYSITMPSGMKAVFDDANGPNVTITSPAGNSIALTDAGGGKIAATVAGSSVTVTPTEVDVTASATVQVNAASVKVSAPSVTVDAAISKFSGIVQCDTLIASSVVGTSYSPGAGNLW